MPPVEYPKKLIEVALPLDDINIAAAREKSIRHGHPSTLHLWWARRPLAAARAVLFAQLVNDPGGKRGYGAFKGQTKDDAYKERERLFQIIRELVKWENTTNEEVLERARVEIRKSWAETCRITGEDPEKMPPFLDPFAGGGSIPLEAQRLGLEAHASDLNPVAVMINKAMIEIPPKFAGRKPVFLGAQASRLHNAARMAALPGMKEDWRGAKGLAEDVRRYGWWMREEAWKRIGHLYPEVDLPKEQGGGKATVIAWLWARTVASPNPAMNGEHVPLISSYFLSTKKGKEAYVQPVVEGKAYRFTIVSGNPADPEAVKAGTKLGRGANFQCLLSGTPIAPDYIKAEGKAGRLGARLMAIVAEGRNGRIYLPPSKEMEEVARQAEPGWRPDQPLPINPRWFSPPDYGMPLYSDLFTPRQLTALTTYSDLVLEAREKVIADAKAVAFPGSADVSSAFSTTSGRDARAPRWHSRGYLPHWEGGEIPQSITFRLHDSLPSELLDHWREELDRLPETERQRERRKRIEAALDSGHGACHLNNPPIAQLVEGALLFFDGERYRLHAWVIMPNHVHVLVTPLHGFTLSSIIHSWKSFTAKQANALLGRTGAFWLEEYFDRAIRDEIHYGKVVEYIENNPVKAGLCGHASEWPFGSARSGGGKSAALGARTSCPPNDVMRAGRPRSQDDIPLCEGGTGATAYGDAVAVYLAFAVEKAAESLSTICTWSSATKNELVVSTFRRQALPMTWDFAEAKPFAGSSGAIHKIIDAITRVIILALPATNAGTVIQANAAEPTTGLFKIISTDPPYYDNIGYADLSDFFYVWLRRPLKNIFPDIFSTMLVPKGPELVATPYRHGGKAQAERFFMEGMTKAIHNMAVSGHPAFPVTIYYAFKQSDTSEAGTSSTGWETFLEAVIKAGFAITGTWPMRTEMGNRMIGSGTNALASSIVLVCRKRPGSAGVPPANTLTISRKAFLRELEETLPEALEEMIGGKVGVSPIAPVDLAQAAIGPGMAVFSQYVAVLEADGTPMTVHTALILINKAIDEFFSHAESDMGADTRFCVDWFQQYGFKEGPFGEADVLARAKGTSVEAVKLAGVITATGGRVRLLKVEEYPGNAGILPAKRAGGTPALPGIWEACHHLCRALSETETAAGILLAAMPDKTEPIRQLAYRLYTLCERKGWADDARRYNELIISWPAIVDASRELGGTKGQMKLF